MKIQVSVTFSASRDVKTMAREERKAWRQRIIFIFHCKVKKCAKTLLPKFKQQFFYTHTNTTCSLKKGGEFR
ncbi:MAG: hypothetical protein CL596_05415 [Alteromonas sp.]|nr:hypothetical protein [Alteromonas sp.]|tara:strand:+ start:682 stop:897 length:216 start_codon:yes stop_codon:yes gene_type:complete